MSAQQSLQTTPSESFMSLPLTPPANEEKTLTSISQILAEVERERWLRFPLEVYHYRDLQFQPIETRVKMAQQPSISHASLCDLCKSIFQGAWEYAREQREVVFAGARMPPDRMICADSTLVKISDTRMPGQTHMMCSLHHSVASLKRSAGRCIVCAKVWDRLRSDKHVQFDRNHPPEDVVGFYSLGKDGDFISISYAAHDMNLWQWPPPCINLPLNYRVDARKSSSRRHVYETSKPMAVDLKPITAPLREQSIAEMRRWLSACATSTNRTFTDCSTRRLPSRLLVIGQGFGKPTIRLCETTQFDENTTYITLSHCWGDRHGMQLRNGSYQSFLRDIPFDDLPRTFQDAVEFTLSLQAKYLWIDSLCIIQDSNQDWLKEGQLMSSVYTQAFVNLAATSSKDSHGGLFYPDSLLRQRCAVNVSWSGQVEIASPVEVLSEDEWELRVEGGPLNQRAWALQEVLLAPRTIHFAYDQMWWTSSDCSGVFNETYPAGVPNTSQNTRIMFRSNSTAQQIRQCWRKVIQKYTRRNLSFSSDKLIALGGIAEAYQQIYRHVLPPDSYAAGMWKPFLLEDLLWSVSSPTCRPAEYHAPSWSWASNNGPIRPSPLYRSGRLYTSLVDVVTSQVSGPYGPVQGGHLILRGILIPITLKQHHCGSSHICINRVVFQENFLREIGQQFNVSLDCNAEYWKWPESIPAFLAAFDEFRYLILERTGNSKGQFRRIGVLSTMNGCGFHEFLRHLFMDIVCQPVPMLYETDKWYCKLCSLRDHQERPISKSLRSQYDVGMSSWARDQKERLDDLIEYLSPIPDCMTPKILEDNYLNFEVDSNYYTYIII